MARGWLRGSRGRTRTGNLQNWHPAACGDLDCAHDNDIVTGDSPLSDPPVWVPTARRECMLRRNERVAHQFFVGRTKNKKKKAVP
jgi:hypothetical protein